MFKILLPLHFTCQIIGPGDLSYGNFTVVQNMSVVTQPSAIPEDYAMIPSLGVAYKYYHSRQASWSVARKNCIANGANLAVLDTFEKIAYAMQVKGPENAPHVGIHRLFDKIEWTSVKTGFALPSVPWAPEPSTNTPDWDCAALYPDGRGLAAQNCSDGRGYICEISLIENSPNDGVITLTPN